MATNGKNGNQNASKGSGSMRGALAARCSIWEEEIIERAADQLGLGKSEFIRQAAVTEARRVVEVGDAPAWAQMAKT